MEKFTKLKTEDPIDENKSEILYSNDYIKVIEYEGWNFVEESSMIICIPFIIERNSVILRSEYIPTYKYESGQEFHLTVLSGTIEKGETPEQTLRRELIEEAGIELDHNKVIEFLEPLFVSKGNTAKYYPCILPISEIEYNEVIAKGDGSKAEEVSKCILVGAQNVLNNNLKPSDTITALMLEYFKSYMNL